MHIRFDVGDTVCYKDRLHEKRYIIAKSSWQSHRLYKDKVYVNNALHKVKGESAYCYNQNLTSCKVLLTERGDAIIPL